MDIYDSMLDSIQQFPLDANYFERLMHRINKRIERYTAAYTRALQKMPLPTSKAYEQISKKLEGCIRKKMKIIKKYRHCVEQQLKNLEEYNKISSSPLTIKEPVPEGTAVLKLKDCAVLESKSCICNSTDGGTMVCCDSPDCAIRWYHLRCVGLGAVPGDGWICKKCKRDEVI